MTNAEILMIVFTAVIAITGVIGAIVFNNQLSVMQGQLNVMRADQRPWIKVDEPIPVVGLEYIPQAEGHNLIAQSAFHFKLTNTGKTPALFVYVDAKMESIFQQDYVANQAAFCAKIKEQRSKSGSPGVPLFPNDATIQPSIALLEVTKTPILPIVTPVLYGCVTYRLSLEDEWRQTGFMYMLGDTRLNTIKDNPRDIGVKKNVSTSVDISRGNVPTENLSIVQMDSGGGNFAN